MSEDDDIEETQSLAKHLRASSVRSLIVIVMVCISLLLVGHFDPEGEILSRGVRIAFAIISAVGVLTTALLYILSGLVLRHVAIVKGDSSKRASADE